MTKTESKLPKRDSPITVEEITEASDIFFPLFNEVSSRMPDKASTEDTLRVMENVIKLAQSERSKKREKEVKMKFGFNKDAKEDSSDDEGDNVLDAAE